MIQAGCLFKNIMLPKPSFKSQLGLKTPQATTRSTEKKKCLKAYILELGLLFSFFFSSF